LNRGLTQNIDESTPSTSLPPITTISAPDHRGDQKPRPLGLLRKRPLGPGGRHFRRQRSGTPGDGLPGAGGLRLTTAIPTSPIPSDAGFNSGLGNDGAPAHHLRQTGLRPYQRFPPGEICQAGYHRGSW
jgi:hypothetical protein